MSRHVPGLGEVSAHHYPAFGNVEQYRGIPYGSVTARWRQSRLVTNWPESRWDGTKYGPISPFPKFVIGMGITQKSLPLEHGYEMDEFKCLNLNVTCPKDCTAESKLPVVVWIHGGGNVVGLGSSADYNAAPLVNFSVKEGKPIVVVTINYRLGPFGFLASKDIQEDNEAVGDKGCGNYGTRDQLIAYEWVKKNIAAFGGDAGRITGMGESAGSINTHNLIMSELFKQVQPFSQAILQSGVGLRHADTMEKMQAKYDKFAAFHKIQGNATPAERLQALRDVTSEDFVNGYSALGPPIMPWQATIDGYFIKSATGVLEAASVKYHSSLKRLLIGDCQTEGTIFALPIQKQQWTFGRLDLLARKLLGNEAAEEVYEVLKISQDSTPQQLNKALIRLASDADWSQPIESVTKTFPGDVFYYHISQGNPFEGPIKGIAGHGTDLIYIFLTYQAELPDNLQKLGTKLASHWIDFIYGRNPWTPYKQSSSLMQYGPDATHAEMAETSKVSYENLRLVERLQPAIGTLTANLRGASHD